MADSQPIAVIRADASPQIGAGHITRCFALAESLADIGWRVLFAVKPEALATLPLLAEGKYEVIILDGAEFDEPALIQSRISQGVSLLIIDHYGRDIEFEKACRVFTQKILVFDDGTGRTHDCDFLVDAATRDLKSYAGLIPASAQAFLGIRYAIVRKSFVRRRNEALALRDGRPVCNILVSFGATDPSDVTSMALSAIRPFVQDIGVTVALSSNAPHLEVVRKGLRDQDRLVLDADMVELGVRADLAIGAGGASAYERAVLGLPSIMVRIADNQQHVCGLFIDAGAAVYAGAVDDGLVARLGHAAVNLLSDPAIRVSQARNTSSFVDGGGAHRVAQHVSDLSKLADVPRA